MTDTLPKEIVFAAQEAQRTWLVPAAVTLAQWALESAWGTREPAGSNNPFGIKATEGQAFVETATHEVVDGKEIATTAKFAKYATLQEAFDAHGKLLATHPAYKKAMVARFNADDFANALTGVYATDPNYGAKLISLMKAHNFYAYDQLPAVEPPVATAPTAAPVGQPVVSGVITLPAEPQIEHQDATVLASIDKCVADLLQLKAQLTSLNSTLKGILG